MKFKWAVLAGAALFAASGVIAADPALARTKHKAVDLCAPAPQHFSWYGFFFNPRPQPNGCAPPVYADGRYIGQDPDPRIRHQLAREPDTGYDQHH